MCTYLQCVNLSNYKFFRGLLTELKITVIQSMIKRLHSNNQQCLELTRTDTLNKAFGQFFLHINLCIEDMNKKSFKII